MRVKLLTTSVRGGAGKAALRLHQGLLQIGISSSILNSASQDGSQHITIPQSLSKYSPRSILQKLEHLVFKCARRLNGGTVDTTPLKNGEVLSGISSLSGRRLNFDFSDCDLVHLHWIAGFVDFESLIRKVGGRIPLVWTLHDMRAFTGVCHYDGGCGKFADPNGCSSCPQLRFSGRLDASELNFRRSMRIYSMLREGDLHIVAPSVWLSQQSKASQLLGRFPTSVIPYGLDLEVFRPVCRQTARKRLGLSMNYKTVLFVADSFENTRKNFSSLQAAMAVVSKRVNDLHMIVVGRGVLPTDMSSNSHVHQLGNICDDEFLNAVYSAADVFVIPSLQDNLPNTVLESMASGTPVVGFDVGGISDMVRHDATGWLASDTTSDALADMIENALHQLDCPVRRDHIRSTCRTVVEKEYGLSVQAQRYESLYAQIIEVFRKTDQC